MKSKTDRGTKRRNKRKQTFLNALYRCLGNKTAACLATGISRNTVYEWIRSDKDFESKIEECLEINLDFVESKLFEGIRKGDARLIIFYLESHGKKRGYGKQEQKAENPTVVFSTEELKY